MIGTTELIVIALVIFVLFGAGSIPKFARSLGEAKAEFEKGFKDNTKKDEKTEEKTEPEKKS